MEKISIKERSESVMNRNAICLVVLVFVNDFRSVEVQACQKSIRVFQQLARVPVGHCLEQRAQLRAVSKRVH